MSITKILCDKCRNIIHDDALHTCYKCQLTEAQKAEKMLIISTTAFKQECDRSHALAEKLEKAEAHVENYKEIEKQLGIYKPEGATLADFRSVGDAENKRLLAVVDAAREVALHGDMSFNPDVELSKALAAFDKEQALKEVE